MTVQTAVFAWQLKYLHDNGYTIVPLRDVVDFAMGHGHLPARAVAITADDGHRSVFTEMKPLVERYRIPVTLFIYPSAISKASYAMTWQELAELKETGLFDVQSHTFWHPNFRIEKRRRTPADYERFVRDQLSESKRRLEEKLGGRVDMLAWPFGIYDDHLVSIARKCGYVAGFSLERRPVTSHDSVMAVPRYMLTGKIQGRAFELIVEREPSVPEPRGENVR